jgi:cytochrome oxidase Cu insertion factor (SCO1/SenC/PrrC family)
MNMRRWTALIPVLLVTACQAANAQHPSRGGALTEGSPAPEFTAQGDDGKTYDLAALKGKYVVL